MSILKKILAGSKKGSCCDVKFEDVSPKSESGCCGGKKEGAADTDKK